MKSGFYSRMFREFEEQGVVLLKKSPHIIVDVERTAYNGDTSLEEELEKTLAIAERYNMVFHVYGGGETVLLVDKINEEEDD